jgi:methyl-accepting chemotaxis protein
MRWKIIIVNAGIVLVVGILTYVLLHTSLREVVADQAERKREVGQALRAANAQLALDALRLERWLSEQVSTEPVKDIFSAGTPSARMDAATSLANKLRDDAVGRPEFAKMAPSLVLFVDAQGVALGRNGSALMRGERMAEAYPSLGQSLETGQTSSDAWVNRQRQEQMLVSYAPVRGEGGSVVGAVVVGTPLNDERLARTSELTSGQLLVFGVLTADKQVEIVANSGRVESAVVSAANSGAVRQAAQAALANNGLNYADDVAADHLFGAAPLEGYGQSGGVVIAAVPASLVASMSSLLWPVFGVALLGILLVVVGGFMLGNYISGPISELEDGLLAIINGTSDLRFQIEHAELGGLVFRINSLLNALMGVAEDTTDEQGRPSRPPSAADFQEALAVDESSVASQNVDPEVAAQLAAEPTPQYYRRLFSEYIRAKRQLGDPVDHITEQAFVARIEGSEQEMAAKYGRPVRYQVQVREGAVVLIAVPLPS